MCRGKPLLRPRRKCAVLDGVVKRLRPLVSPSLHPLPHALCRLFAHAGIEGKHALPGKLILRIRQHPQEGEHVFDMRLLEIPESSALDIGNIVLGKRQLQLQRLKRRAKEHGDILQRHSLVRARLNVFDDIAGLCVHVGRFRKHGKGFRSLARALQLFFVPRLVIPDALICQTQNLGPGAVIGLQSKYLGPRVQLGKIKNVAHVGRAERIDRLRIVAHHHEIAVMRGKERRERRLQVVGVLVFVHEHVLKPARERLMHIRMALKQPHAMGEQPVKIHGLHRLQPRAVRFVKRVQERFVPEELRELVGERVMQAAAAVAHIRQHAVQRVRLGKPEGRFSSVQ